MNANTLSIVLKRGGLKIRASRREKDNTRIRDARTDSQ